jgi:hypothetical protein
VASKEPVKYSVVPPEEPPQEGSAHDDADTRPRWWQRSPVLGIAAGLATGVSGIWLLRALGRPAQSADSAFLYMATLPIALMLPALALFGALIGWRSHAALRGPARLAWAAPAVAAVALNILAIGMFLRFVIQIFSG